MTGLCEYIQLVLLDSHTIIITLLLYFLLSSSECLNYNNRKGFDVTVYEKTSEFARFGGPIQFASNALSVLKEIDDRLFDRVMEKFTFTGIRTCGIKDGTDGSIFNFCLHFFSDNDQKTLTEKFSYYVV
ncbi:MAG: hypothetical protein ACI90V_009845 [Bacillariaceae sp.]|jgi:hypothetical protein